MTPTPDKIVLVSPRQDPLPDVHRVLSSLGPPVEVRERLEVDGWGASSLLLVSYDSLSEDEYANLISLTKGPVQPRLVILTRGQRTLRPLFESRGLRNLVAHDVSDDGSDLRVTLRKLLTGDLFGLEKYFGANVPMVRLKLAGTRQRAEAIDAVEKLAAEVGVARRLAAHFSLVADEFMTNALFNAPVDASGTALYRHLSRAEDVVLPPEKTVELCLATDGNRLGISTLDRFGSLSPELVVEYLSKCFKKDEHQIDQKEGGAGLGFFMVFESLTHFVINIAPGRRTEMIGLIDVRGSYKAFAQRTKSFNIFVDGSP